MTRTSRHRAGWGLAAALAVVLASHGAAFAGSDAPDQKEQQGSTPPDPAVAYAQDRYGLTRAEAERRVELQPAVARLDRRLRELSPRTYAGAWIDQDNGGLVRLLTTDADGTASREAAAHGLAEESVEQEVPYSAADLEAFQERLLRAARQLSEVVQVGGIETDRNALSVVVDPDSEVPPEVRDIERSHPGSLHVQRGKVRPVKEEACRYPYCDPPLRGGVEVTKAANGKIYACTVGFNVKSLSDSKPYILTAGHCLRNTASSTAAWWSKFADLNPHAVGPHHKYVYGATGYSGIVAISNPGGWLLSNTIANWGCCLNGYVTARNESYVVSGTGGSTIGMMLCYSGATSGTGCGRVTQLGYTSVNGVGGLGVFDADTPCEGPGDSGGPVFASGTAYGIVHGSTSAISGECQKLYQGITDALADMNVRLF